MTKKTEDNITKIYVYPTKGARLSEKDICYLVMSNKCFPRSIKKLANYNWIVTLEYEDYNNFINVLNTKLVREKDIEVKRIFKSMQLYPGLKDEVHKSFLIRVVMGICELIKKPVDIRILNNRANDWQKEMTKIWQEEIENPNRLKKAGIKCVVDISPKGSLIFRIIKGKKYVVTFFDEIIDDYIQSENEETKETETKKEA